LAAIKYFCAKTKYSIKNENAKLAEGRRENRIFLYRGGFMPILLKSHEIGVKNFPKNSLSKICHTHKFLAKLLLKQNERRYLPHQVMNI